MENITEIEVQNSAGELVKHIIIDNGDGSFTSMVKARWDEQQANQQKGM